MSAPSVVRSSSRRRSLHDEARLEADRFKWIESERRGYDLGGWAYREWCRRHWIDFCRWKRVEHLLGHREYAEFDSSSFGKLRSLADTETAGAIVDFVIERFTRDRWENLHFFIEAHPTAAPTSPLQRILRILDINGVRLDPPNWGCYDVESVYSP